MIEIRENRIISIEYLKCNNENPTNTTVFLFHGAMGSSSQFDYILPALQNKFNICKYDALGCGHSDKPHNMNAYNTRSMCLDGYEIYKRYSTTNNILIGHSYGTSLISWLIKDIKVNDSNYDNEKHISSIILLGTALNVESIWLFKMPLLFLQCISNSLAIEGAKSVLSSKASLDLKTKIENANKSNDMYVVKAFWSQMEWASKEDFLYLNDYPLLIIQGNDDVLTTVNNGQQLYDILLLNNNKHMKVINDTGHLIMMEKPNETVELIFDFLNNL